MPCKRAASRAAEKKTKSHRPLSTDSAKAAPASTKNKVQSSIRKQQAMAKKRHCIKTRQSHIFIDSHQLKQKRYGC